MLAVLAMGHPSGNRYSFHKGGGDCGPRDDISVNGVNCTSFTALVLCLSNTMI